MMNFKVRSFDHGFFSLKTNVMIRTENIFAALKCAGPRAKKQTSKCRFGTPLCTCSIKADPVSVLRLWKTAKVNRLHGSSDIHSGLQ